MFSSDKFGICAVHQPHIVPPLNTRETYSHAPAFTQQATASRVTWVGLSSRDALQDFVCLAHSKAVSLRGIDGQTASSLRSKPSP